MVAYQAPLRDMQFVLYEVCNATAQWAQWPATQTRIDQETANALLAASAKRVADTIAPLNRPGDEQGCQWHDGQVTTPSGYRDAFRQLANSGWIGLAGEPTYGGMGLPYGLTVQCDEMLCSANLAFALYPSLTYGVALALATYGSADLQACYLPRLYQGDWTGTMCLTEAQAGSDLGLLRTQATPNNDGSYAISGTKLFISGGEHDLADNIIHLVLARLPDAPAGTKGLSLFLVPKIQVNDDGSLGKPNGVHCGSIEQKMGLTASATCVMHFDGACGYRIGDANQGLAAMFTVINHERLFVGVQGLGCGAMAYQEALAYARDRRQGRAATQPKPANGQNPAHPILVHGDIRRMLLNIKALNEAGRACATYLASQLDVLRFSDHQDQRQRAAQQVALLTPLTKAFLTDQGLTNCVTAQQIVGGHGYIREGGQEQHVRDVRVTQIYEGTNGIQALDLLQRKIAGDDGVAFEQFIAEMRQAITGHHANEWTAPLTVALERLVLLTRTLLIQAQRDANVLNAAGVEYLHAFGYVVYGWLWARMATIAQQQLAAGTTEVHFYEGKLHTARHYFNRLLPRFYSLAEAAESGTEALYALRDDQF